MSGTILFYALFTIPGALLIFWLIGERGHLMRSSTWAGLKANGLRNLLNLNALHMYIYGRWTGPYLKYLSKYHFPRLSDRKLKKWDDNYHAKILTHDHAEAIIMLDRDIERQGMEQIIPYPTARDIIIQSPPDIVAYECGCRYFSSKPCEPTQVCLVIGKPFTDFALEHNPDKSRRISQSEALQILREEHERGHIHSAWFKDALLDRFFSICNCCKCCCAGIERMKKYGYSAIVSSGFVSRVDNSNCNSCGICADACPFDAISVENTAVIDWNRCMGCGVCTSKCPSESITLVRDEKKGIPMDVRML